MLRSLPFNESGDDADNGKYQSCQQKVSPCIGSDPAGRLYNINTSYHAYDRDNRRIDPGLFCNAHASINSHLRTALINKCFKLERIFNFIMNGSGSYRPLPRLDPGEFFIDLFKLRISGSQSGCHFDVAQSGSPKSACEAGEKTHDIDLVASFHCPNRIEQVPCLQIPSLCTLGWPFTHISISYSVNSC